MARRRRGRRTRLFFRHFATVVLVVTFLSVLSALFIPRASRIRIRTKPSLAPTYLSPGSFQLALLSRSLCISTPLRLGVSLASSFILEDMSV
jgi:hypothetical protein